MKMSILKDTVIEKLNNKNYDTWRFRVENYLQKENLFNVIIDEPPNPVTEDWRNKNRQARAIINLLIDDSQIIHVKNLETARECWLSLKNIHERTTLSSKLFLLRKLYSIKLSESGDMQKHITKIYEARDKLISIGEQIDEQHLAALLLCSLPESYNTLITALEARPEAELTAEFIRNKLLDEYNRRTESSNEPNHNSAMKVKYQKPKSGTNKFCKYCKKTSHNIESCWNLKNKNKSENYKQNSQQRYNQFAQRSAICSQDNKTADRNKTLNNEKVNYPDKNFTFYIGDNPRDSWIIDSGSSMHVCNNKNKFDEFNENNTNVTIANGQKLESLGFGSVKLSTVTSNNVSNTITLKNVLYVPEIETNLISIKRATENGCVAIFENNSCKITHEGNTCIEGYINNNLYECKTNDFSENTVNMVQVCKNKNCLYTWHKRLGHRNTNHIKELVSKDMAKGITLDSCKHDNACEICIMSKLTDNPYPKTASFRASKTIELVHSDLSGPMQTATVGGKYYFLTFVDDFSRFTIIYLLRNKNEVLSKLKEYVAMTANKFGRKVQNFRSDNGGEYSGKEFDDYLKNEGINHQFTVPYSAPQNGVAERKNRTLMEMARCLLKESGLPNSFWGEAINTATYLQNRLPTSSCDSTPYERWTGRKPDLSNIKTFGCRAYAYVQKIHRGKLDNTAQQGIFVGYDGRSNGYRICTDGRKIIISRTVKFLENENQELTNDNELNKNQEMSNDSHLPTKLQIIENETNNTGNDMQSQNDNSNSSDGTQTLPRRSNRSNRGVPPDRFAFTINNTRIVEPKCWDDIENMQNPAEKKKWIDATLDEMNSLNDNKTWELVEAPPGTRVIGCKWAFKSKYNSQGLIEKYKARLVAKGFSQKFGVDYDETFAPVASHTTIRSFLAMAVYKNLNLRHIDIKTAFLHGDLQENIYMHQPEGYVISGQEHKVCKLKKAIYGLKQAARAWNLKIHDTLIKIGFNQSQIDKCLYKQSKDNKTTYVIVYVDDLLIAGEDQYIDQLINKLRKEYPVTDLGEANYYLGININRPSKGKMTLDQINKIHELIIKFGLENSKPSDIPMEPGYVKINDEENLLPDNNKYRQAVGALLYISTISRPDICAAVNILSRRNERPRTKDWEAVKRTIRYLKTTINYKLTFDNLEKPVLRAYSDSDWANDPQDRRSTSGNLFLLGNNPILWLSKRQQCVTVSSAEAEYVAAANAAQEIKYIINVLKELDMPQQQPITLFEDNQSCIKLAESDKYHQKTKHIDIRYHLLRQLVNEGMLKLQYVDSNSMSGDALTKPLPKKMLQLHLSTLMNIDHQFENLRRGVGHSK